ncbi:uncharacterized protein LOC112462309 [Temnothorax curvispinosus]|uniref:Uncharacterized protein LOC112462309 n=1 Tax=Temnothorax curvispinosus TaxID=300111 RepID=A0A6J1QMW7_9HYME|nr:uncharacterized protein LOC112462309 [Temnothorax curvispinosus]
MNAGRKGMKSKYCKISSSGRVVKTPKNVMTTSSDEELTKRMKKKSSKQYSVQVELNKLEGLVEYMQKNDAFPKTDTTNANKSNDTIQNSTMKDLQEKNLNREVHVPQPNKHANDDTPPVDGFVKKTSVHAEHNRALDALNMQETCKCKTNNQDIHDKLTDLQDKVNSLIESQNALKEIMEKIVENDNVHVDGVNLRNTFYEGLEGFPMSTVEEFKELESDAKKNDRRKLYNYLRGLGGCKLREFLYNAIKTIMTDSLVSKFTWPVSNVSEKFGDTKTMNIIYLAAQKCTLFNGPQDKASCKVEVQEVLRP